MNSLKIFVLIFCFLFLQNYFIAAQEKNDYKFGKIGIADFEIKSPLITPSTSAIFIADVGSTEFIGNKNSWFSRVYKTHERIKIINKKGFDFATIKIRLFGKGDKKDIVSEIKASTFNIENEQVVEKKIENSEIFESQLSSNLVEKKFTLPSVKEGSIIEYSYTVTSYRFHTIPTWYFQNQFCPSLYSEYSVVIPSMLNYLIEHRGIDTFAEQKRSEVYRHYIAGSFSIQDSKANNFSWVMKDVPPYNNEDYIKNSFENMDKLEFHLIETYNGRDVNSIAISWEVSVKDLLRDISFGSKINENNISNLSSIAKKICGDENDNKKNAKKIYEYVRDNFTSQNDNDIYVERDLYDVNKTKKGTTSEINLLLIALLKLKEISAEPVILSTQNFAINSAKYPMLDKINYVVCITILKGDTIYLDASQPELAFGKLPLYCYNGHARIINKENSGSLFLYPDYITETETVNAIIINNDNSQMIGTITNVLDYYQSFNFRNNLAEEKKYLENEKKKILASASDEMQISNLSIDSLNNLEDPISKQWDVKLTEFGKKDIVYFSPLIGTEIKKNPFIASERIYPIELDYRQNKTFILSMEIPNGYKVEELPKSAKVNLNTQDGNFEYITSVENNQIYLRCKLVFNKATFAKEDYQALREFYTYIIKKEAEQIVFKKK